MPLTMRPYVLLSAGRKTKLRRAAHNEQLALYASAMIRLSRAAGLVVILFILMRLATHPGSASWRETEQPNTNGPSTNLCDLPTSLKAAYDRMSAQRKEAITKLVVVPEAQSAEFQAAYERFNSRLDGLMHEHVDILSEYFKRSIRTCDATSPTGASDIIRIEEAKTKLLKAYAADISAILPAEKVEELIETDLQLIHLIEVRLGNLAYRTYNSITGH